jgi:hypothetical protein
MSASARPTMKPVGPLELAAAVEEFGLFGRTAKSVRLTLFLPDKELARRIGHKFQLRVKEYERPDGRLIWIIDFGRRLTSKVAGALAPLFGCSSHRELARLLPSLLAANHKIMAKTGRLNNPWMRGGGARAAATRDAAIAARDALHASVLPLQAGARKCFKSGLDKTEQVVVQ